MSKTESDLGEEVSVMGSWGEFNVGHELIVRRFGPLSLLFKRVSNEIWIASDRSQTEQIDTESLVWSRWALKKDQASITLLPMMPDRQVVVRPEYPFMLSPRAEVRIFTRIPTWVGIMSNDIKNHKLTEIPTVTLSKTWFGDFLDGVLCYWLSTTARREVDLSLMQPHLALSTLHIRNDSSDDLKIEKLTIRVERLSVFTLHDNLWTDEMEIRFMGEEQNSDITMTGRPPSEAKGAKLISSPRNPVRKSIAERTFSMLKEIPGFT